MNQVVDLLGIFGMCELKLPMFGQLVYPCGEIPTLAEEKSKWYLV